MKYTRVGTSVGDSVISIKQRLFSLIELLSKTIDVSLDTNLQEEHPKREIAKYSQSVMGKDPTVPIDRHTTSCETFRCPCGLEITDPAELAEHKRTHEFEGWWCYRCPNPSSEKWLELRSRVDPKDFEQNLAPRGAVENIDLAEKRRVREYWKKSSGPFKSANSVWKHFRTIHLARYTHLCDICVYGNDDREVVAAHRYSKHQIPHADGLYRCKIRCGKIFSSRKSYNRHIVERTCERSGKRRYPCSTCFRKYKSVKLLALHCKKMHTNAHVDNNSEL